MPLSSHLSLPSCPQRARGKHEHLVDDRFFLICNGQDRFRVTSIVRVTSVVHGEGSFHRDSGWRCSTGGTHVRSVLASSLCRLKLGFFNFLSYALYKYGPDHDGLDKKPGGLDQQPGGLDWFVFAQPIGPYKAHVSFSCFYFDGIMLLTYSSYVIFGNNLAIVSWRSTLKISIVFLRNLHFTAFYGMEVYGFVELWFHRIFRCYSTNLPLQGCPLDFFKSRITIALSRHLLGVESRSYFQVVPLMTQTTICIYQLYFLFSVWFYCFAAAYYMLGALEAIHPTATQSADIFSSKSLDLPPRQASSTEPLLYRLSLYAARSSRHAACTLYILFGLPMKILSISPTREVNWINMTLSACLYY